MKFFTSFLMVLLTTNYASAQLDLAEACIAPGKTGKISVRALSSPTNNRDILGPTRLALSIYGESKVIPEFDLDYFNLQGNDGIFDSTIQTGAEASDQRFNNGGAVLLYGYTGYPSLSDMRRTSTTFTVNFQLLLDGTVIAEKRFNKFYSSSGAGSIVTGFNIKRNCP